MSPGFREIEEQAKKLPPEERARLAESLLESLEQQGAAEIEAARDQEIQDSVAKYKRGEEVVDGEAVLVELRLSACFHKYGDVYPSVGESCVPACRVGPASLPAKTTGTEAGPTHDVNESSTLGRTEKMRDRIYETVY